MLDFTTAADDAVAAVIVATEIDDESPSLFNKEDLDSLVFASLLKGVTCETLEVTLEEEEEITVTTKRVTQKRSLISYVEFPPTCMSSFIHLCSFPF